MTFAQVKDAVAIYPLDIFGCLLAGDRLGLAGWMGCALILPAIVVAEPTAAKTLRTLVGRPA